MDVYWFVECVDQKKKKEKLCIWSCFFVSRRRVYIIGTSCYFSRGLLENYCGVVGGFNGKLGLLRCCNCLGCFNWVLLFYSYA